ncbi:MAG: ABC transporter permease [Bacteroidetes bacterium]|nr:ABC transporter permease [Bacteroidota bacterium]MBT6686621.1 ABC transporter permease [Bacteroidota bacterium]MBT7143824.1 ABC transporter permease [Bacteroidota bacterium]MBT7491709.1 ABC transporter permease [Bacteroidota bacterium]
MNTIKYLLQKEFIQIFRNKTLLPLIFVLPVVQLIILVNAATFEMKNIDMIVLDKDLSQSSRNLISKFEGSPFYHINSFTFSLEEAEEKLLDNSADVILNIPANFERDLLRNNKSKIQFLINAINGTAAGLINAYSISIVQDFNKEIIQEWYDLNQIKIELPIKLNYRYWFNENLEYTIYMLPGILVILVTLIGMFLSALNIVREKEIGTIEQINVTPIKKYQFIIGKLLPFLIIALFEMAFGLVIGRLLFDQPMVGSLWLLFGFTFVYLLVALGLGLFFSAISANQQQVMFTVYFFLLTFILMSGIFTPVESMPDWAQIINRINPFMYFMKAIRMILLKGSGFFDILDEFVSLSIYAVVILSLAIWRYRKTV